MTGDMYTETFHNCVRLMGLQQVLDETKPENQFRIIYKHLGGHSYLTSNAELEDGYFQSAFYSSYKSWNSLRRILGKDLTTIMTPQKLVVAALEKLELLPTEISEESVPKALAKLVEGKGVDAENLFNDVGVIIPGVLVLLTRALTSKISGEDISEHEDEESVFEYLGNNRSVQVSHICRDIMDSKIVLNPPWQRADVWSDTQKRRLIISLLTGVPIPTIIMTVENDASYVLDGKQRLTAIQDFTFNKWKLGTSSKLLPDRDMEGGFNLKDCRGKFWRELPVSARNKIERTDLPIIEINSMPNGGTYTLFDLYNTSGKKLTGVELRNATYHNTEFHKMMFAIAGESDEGIPEVIMDDYESQVKITESLRKISSGPRFQTLNFIEKYFGYSYALSSKWGEDFRPTTADRAVKLFYFHLIDEKIQTHQSDLEIDVKDALDEITSAVSYANKIFTNPWGAYRNNSTGGTTTVQVSEARSITTLIVGAMINLVLQVQDPETHDELIGKIRNEIVHNIENKSEFNLPENEISKTLWKYTMKWTVAVFNRLEAMGLSEPVLANQKFARLINTSNFFLESLEE